MAQATYEKRTQNPSKLPPSSYVQVSTTDRPRDLLVPSDLLIRWNSFARTCSKTPFAHALLAFTGCRPNHRLQTHRSGPLFLRITPHGPGRPGLYVSFAYPRNVHTKRPPSIRRLLLFWTLQIPKLEDLYVKPENRAAGVGKAFFGHLGKIAQEKVGSVRFAICRLVHGNLTLLCQRIVRGSTGPSSR